MVLPGHPRYPWKTVTDPDTAEVYYFNIISGDTSWDDPLPEVDLTTIAPPLSIRACPTEAEQIEQAIEQAPILQSSKTSEGELQHPWIELVDESTNRVYYENIEVPSTFHIELTCFPSVMSFIFVFLFF
jgi:hypothetical protein